jgi:hypothetical protein
VTPILKRFPFRLFYFVQLFVVGNAVAQIEYEEGYLINNDSVRIPCQIFNKAWDYNPGQFQFRRQPNGPEQVGTLDDVREFGTSGGYKYVRAELLVDQSTDDLQKVGTNKDPIWATERIFLKVLVEGKATLYHLKTNDGRTRFFFSMNGGKIQQLIYKQYTPKPMELVYNDGFRQQLYLQVNCFDEEYKELTRVNYRASDLTTFFKKYNACSGDERSSAPKPLREVFRFNIKTGISTAGLSVAHTYTYVMPEVKFPTKVILMPALEGEWIMPFNKSKWSVPVEASYQQYSGEKQITYKGPVSAQYRGFQLAFGVRHHLFLKNGSRFFINGLLNYNITDTSYSKLYLPHRTLTFSTGLNLGAGAGIAVGFFSAELRYYTAKTLLTSYLGWNSQYRVLSLVAGFRLFRTYANKGNR